MRRAVPKVWRICRFRERFEMTGEYERKTGLEYVRQFIGAGGLKSTESTQFLSQLRELKHYYPERHFHFRGIFDELLALAGTVELRFRGFLLNSRLGAAAAHELAARLDVTVKEMREALKALERVGLIERIDLPTFADDPSDEASNDHTERDATKPRSKRRPRTKKAGKGRAKAVCRNNSEMFPNRPEAFARTEMANGKGKGKTTGQRRKGKPEGQAPTSPTTAPPLPAGPPEATAKGPRHFPPTAGRQRTEAPSRVPEQRRHSLAMEERQPAIPVARGSEGPRILPLRHGDAVSLGAMLPRAMDGLAHGYTLRADEFASEVFALLQGPFTADSREGLRERGNYRAALLDAIDAGLSPPQLDELMRKGRTDAGRIAKHRRRYYRNGGSPEQYWRFLFNKHLNSRRGLSVTARQKAGAG